MGNFQQNRPRVQGSWVRGLLVQNIPWLVIVKVLYMRHLLEVFIYAILPSPRRARLSTRPRVQGMGGGWRRWAKDLLYPVLLLFFISLKPGVE